MANVAKPVTKPAVKAPPTKALTAPKPPSAPKAVVAPAAAAAPIEAPKRGPGRPPGKAVNGAPAPEAVKAPAPSSDAKKEAALLAVIEGMKAQIAKLSEQVSKAGQQAKNQGRTAEEILEGAPKLPKQDWRSPYHGQKIFVKQFLIGKDGVVVKDGPEVEALLALPRDKDPGGKGAQNRLAGALAVHWETSEDGETYFGMPAYLLQEELAEVWGDSNG